MNRKTWIVLSIFLAISIVSKAQVYMAINNGIRSTVGSVDIEISFYSPSTVRILKSLARSSCTKESLSNFAKYGHPNGNDVPDWPAFSDAKPVVMYFSQTAHTGPVPSAESLKVLDEYFQWRRTPEGEAWAK